MNQVTHRSGVPLKNEFEMKTVHPGQYDEDNLARLGKKAVLKV